MKKLILLLGCLSSVSAFAGIAKVHGSAKAYFEGDESEFSLFIDHLAQMADENARQKNDLCKIQQVRISDYKVNQLPAKWYESKAKAPGFWKVGQC